jgi:hypothetical protein
LQSHEALERVAKEDSVSLMNRYHRLLCSKNLNKAK